MKVKTHLITTEQYDEYEVRWHKKLSAQKPKFDEHGNLQFAVLSNRGRLNIKTFDLKHLETAAKRFTQPRGRGALTTDKGYIYLKTEDDKEVLLATVIHNHIRKYAPMYDEL